jgi:hypothetical protein
MNKYIVFIKSDKAEVVLKEQATRDFVKTMKRKGYRKHIVEVEAENEKEAIIKVNKESEDYLESLSEYSGNIVIISAVVILMAVVYFFKSYG